MTPKGQILKGYKATDKNMCCRGFQYELGKWYEHKGKLSMCESGFHFCEYPSGPWSYYSDGRLFEVEAEECLLATGPGSDIKHVCKKIRLIKEIKIDGNRNTGNWNTGDRNTGNGNTGNRNTGDWNTGDWNTGDGNTGNWNTGDGNTGNRNTGDRNTGDRNTGDWNTGDRNTGYGNTGYGNTGDRNTGYGNTGDWNTGDRNTGYGNTGNGHSGCLNFGPAPFYIFNKLADLGKVDFSLVNRLSILLMEDAEIDPTPFLSLPNATPKAISDLHKSHIKARQASK